MRFRVLALLFAAFASPVQAGTVNPLLYKYDTCGTYSMLHINGVDTSADEARAQMLALANTYGNAHNEHPMRYGFAHNQSYGLLLDVHQAYTQVIAEFPGVTYEDWIRAVFRQIFPDWWPSDLSAAIMERMRNVLQLRRPDNFYDTDLTRMIQTVQFLGFHGKNNRMVIVGHSQGSIYANILFRRLTDPTAPTAYRMQTKQIGLMSIAAFTDRVEGTGSLYVTNRNDRPVNIGRALYSDTLIGTVTLAQTESFAYPWRGHNLRNIYLAQAAGRDAIVLGMEQVLNGLRPTGPFNFTTYPGNMNHPGVTSAAYSRDCTPAAPCWIHVPALGYAQWFTQPVLFWNEAGVPHQLIQPGSPDSRDSKAEVTALACEALWIAAYKNRVSVPLPYTIPGCEGVNYYYTPSQATYAWSNYSADGTAVSIADWPYSGIPGRRARIYPVCRTET